MLHLSARAAARLGIGALAVITLGLGLGVAACDRPAPPIAGVPDQVDFNFHVKPILSDRCFKCHGPDDRAARPASAST